MPKLGQAIRNLRVIADAVKQQPKRPFVPLLIGKLNPIIRENDMDTNPSMNGEPHPNVDAGAIGRLSLRWQRAP